MEGGVEDLLDCYIPEWLMLSAQTPRRETLLRIKILRDAIYQDPGIYA